MPQALARSRARTAGEKLKRARGWGLLGIADETSQEGKEEMRQELYVCS
jgi:hypothetical protein